MPRNAWLRWRRPPCAHRCASNIPGYIQSLMVYLLLYGGSKSHAAEVRLRSILNLDVSVSTGYRT